MQQHGDTATAEVEVAVPDFRGLLGGAFAATMRGDSQDEIQQSMAEKLDGGDLSVTKRREQYSLLREEGGWRIFHDWATQDRVSSLLVEARELREQKRLGAAISKYDEALQLDSELVEAKAQKEETQTQLAEFEEKQAYIARVDLYDLAARRYDTYLDKGVAESSTRQSRCQTSGSPGMLPQRSPASSSSRRPAVFAQTGGGDS